MVSRCCLPASADRWGAARRWPAAWPPVAASAPRQWSAVVLERLRGPGTAAQRSAAQGSRSPDAGVGDSRRRRRSQAPGGEPAGKDRGQGDGAHGLTLRLATG